MTELMRVDVSGRQMRVREFDRAHVDVVSRECFEAFRSAAGEQFKPDFPTVESVRDMLLVYLQSDIVGRTFWSESDELVGANFLFMEGGGVYSVGPVFVVADKAPKGLGRVLMSVVMEEAHRRKATSVRLTQAGYNLTSFSLYVKCGFTVRELLTVVDITPVSELVVALPSFRCRIALREDIEAAHRLCFRCHGFIRYADIEFSINQGIAQVIDSLQKDGTWRVVAYTTGCDPDGHTVAETNEAMQALVLHAARNVDAIDKRIFIPATNTEFLRWCLDSGMKIESTGTLMTYGQYSTPQLPYLTSIGM